MNRARINTRRIALASSGLLFLLAFWANRPAAAQVLAILPGNNAPTPMGGNQPNFAGPVGMDFVVNTPIQITSLAVFDAAQNGINAAGDLTVELWERNTNGTPSIADDTGLQIVLSDTFSNASPGTLSGKFRTKALGSPFTLQPGNYTISAYGFSQFNNFWNFGEPHDPNIGPPIPNESGGALQFVGTSRFGSGGMGFPGSPDGGPATRYLAGNFAYLPPAFDTLLSIRVNRDTGAITLANGTPDPETILGYSIQSSFGSLNSNNWLSIAANYDDNDNGTVDPDDNWTRLTANGARNDLSEFEFDGGNGATLASQQTVNLGTAAWIKTHVEDLVFQYVLADGTRVDGDIQFTGNGGQPFEFGDLNFNGTPFELNDFTGAGLLLANLISSHPALSPAEAYRLGDLTGDRVVDQDDFRVFKEGFLAGGGSAAALDAAMNVPEPTSLAMSAIGVLAGLFIAAQRKGRRSPLIYVVTFACCGSFIPPASAQIVALQSPAPLIGNQGFGGELGMDFIVQDLPISVSSLGFFDSGQNGLSTSTIHVELWSRNDGGTPNDPADDSGNSILRSTTFSPGDDGMLQGGNRFRAVTPLELAPGAYSIVAGGYSPDDPLANSGELPPVPAPTINDLGGVIEFVGGGRFGVLGPGNFPATPDGGPANRYHSGTFKYEGAFDPLVLEINRATGSVTIRNEGPDSYNTDFYELRSAAGSLNPAGWNSLDDQLPGWLEAGSNDAMSLAEANLTASTLFGPAAVRTLGMAYNTSIDAQDIAFTYVTTGGVSVDAEIRYIGAPAAVPGDYNSNGVVDAADYTVWRDRLGATTALPNEVSGVTPGTVTQEDYTAWKTRFGNTAGAGSGVAAAVPEPNVVVLMLTGALGIAILRTQNRPRFVSVSALLLACCHVLTGSAAYANVTNDRDYRLGDDALEGAVLGQVLGSGNGLGVTRDSQGPTGSFVHLLVQNNPIYANVTDRPGASPGALGASFDGTDDRLFTDIPVGAPTTMWDTVDFFPSGYPLNYESLLSHGMQLWAKPNIAGQNDRQDLIFDTAQHGIFISDDNRWGQRFQQFGIAPTEVISNANVQFGQWTHVMHLSGIADLTDGFSAFNSAILVNGVAVSAIGNVYNGGDQSTLAVGSNQTGDDNFYHGLLDNVRIFLWGNNTGQTNGGMGPNGQDYGRLFLGEDNDWIARQLATLGVTDIADVNLDGDINQLDVSAFVPNWLSRQTLNGVQVGDWNSRQDGDLNYDGAVDLLDAIILHEGLLAGTGTGLDFSLLGATVPEPSTVCLLAYAVTSIIVVRRRPRNDQHVSRPRG